METDPSRMCELLVDLLDVDIKGVEGTPRQSVTVHFECRRVVVGCPDCGVVARVKDRYRVTLVDLPMNGRSTRVVWHKRRFFCPDPACPKASWNEVDTRIAFPRLLMTDRAGRWLTEQIGVNGRSVQEIADELGCDWHTVNDTLLRYGVNYGWSWDLNHSLKNGDASKRDNVADGVASANISRIDLIVRWSGGRRLSFLPIQSIYADSYVVDEPVPRSTGVVPRARRHAWWLENGRARLIFPALDWSMSEGYLLISVVG